MKLKCDYSKAKSLIGWQPKYTLEQGIEETREWIEGTKLLG
jgi:nucleoside-diphosphate-sugar epimerase